jgi:hypothetical protein
MSSAGPIQAQFHLFKNQPLTLEETEGLKPIVTMLAHQKALLKATPKSLSHNPRKQIEQFTKLTKINNKILKTDLAKAEHETIKELKTKFEQALKAFEELIDPNMLLDIQKSILKELSADPSDQELPLGNQAIKHARIANKRLLAAFAATELGHAKKHVHEHDHDHDHADGVVIDLDEAVHGVYASTKYLISALKGNPQHILDEFNRDAHELANTTLTSLRDELVPHGIGEFAASVGVSAIMLPLAYMAAKAGLEEMHHASHEIKDLKRHQSKLEGIQSNLETMNKILESNYLKTEAKVVDSKASVLQRAVKQSKRDWKIGLCSFGSGLSIGTKALSDIGLKVSLGVQGLLTGKGFLGASQVISASTPTALVTTVLGAASTFVLGPLAGLFATGLGAYFTRKSSSKKNQLRTDFGVAARQLEIDPKTGKANASSTETNTEGTESSPPQNTDEAFNTYKEFIGRQGKRRIGFFKGFTRWNKAFMIGSGLYAASATTKAVVAGLALGGIAAAASNPIGLGIITAVGTIGALGMGIASYCFITGHGKQGKYAKHTAGDDKLVDRDLLVRAQTHALDENVIDIKKQVKLASACLTRLNARKDAIRTFLNAAAKSSKNKKGVNKISPFLLTTDGKKTDGAKTDKAQQLTLWKRLQGRALNVKNVEAYIGTNYNQTSTTAPSSAAPEKTVSVLDFANKDLEAEKILLDAQLKAIKTLITRAVEAKPIENPAPTETIKTEDVHAFVAYTEEELIGKQTELNNRLTKTNELLETIKNKEKDTNTKTSLLLEHWGVQVPNGADNKKINHLLAEYLFKQVDKDTRNARGVLFEAQLQASKLVNPNQ